jgi:hypothetical protein
VAGNAAVDVEDEGELPLRMVLLVRILHLAAKLPVPYV